MFPIRITDLEEYGVTLTPSTDPDFDIRAQAILAGRASPVLELEPYLAIVANQDPRTVVAYTVAWTITRFNESTELQYSQFKFPDAVAGTANGGLPLLQGREIRTGQERLVGMGFEVWPAEYVQEYSRFGRQRVPHSTEVKDLHISLDAVVFEDGTLLGADESQLAEHFVTYVQAKQELYRELVVAMEEGESGDRIFAALRKLSSHEPSTADPMSHYAQHAAAEVLGLRDRVLVEVFRRALRREAFKIDRR